MKYGIMKWWFNAMFYGIRLYEGEPGGGGGGEGDDKTFTKDQVSEAITKAVDEATAGLKTKNSDLIGEQKKLAEKLKAFGDITPEKIKDMMDKFDNEDDADLLKSGKIDELVAKRVDKIVAEYDGKLSETEKRAITAEERANLSDKRYNDRVISQELMKSAIEAGIRKEALDDVLASARDIFIVGEDDEIEARDKDGNLRKIGDKLLTPEHWIDSLKESKPHYWPDSAGVGAQGSKGSKGGKSGDLSAKLAAAADAGDMAEYRRLRNEQLKASK